jgi:hypothetical protein
LNKASDRLAYYQQHAEIFESLMYPPFGEYSVIKIPLIPYPVNLMKEVMKLLESGKKELKKLIIPRNVVRGLQPSGLIIGMTYPYITTHNTITKSVLL